MRYYLGVDGGATKTMTALGDKTGRILGIGVGGPSNYQVVGTGQAMRNVRQSVEAALTDASVTIDRVDFGLFALAGADYAVDFKTLARELGEMWPALPLDVTNDTWAALRSGAEKDYGLVFISGTGANFAAKDRSGKKVTGRGIGYQWGSEGGAGSLLNSILHFAFRSHDNTGPKTALEPKVLEILGYADYDELALALYQAEGKLNLANPKAYDLVPVLFDLAFRGDRVSQDILVCTGSVMGEMSGRLLRSLDLAVTEAEVVLAGSTFTKGKSPLLVSGFVSACQRYAPLAKIKFPDMEPAGGAFLLALEATGISTRGKIRKTAIETLSTLAAPLSPDNENPCFDTRVFLK